jgi:hypothetical protein
VLSQDLFGVDESLEREKDALAFGPALLASCTSVLAIFVALYLFIDFLHKKRYKEKNSRTLAQPTSLWTRSLPPCRGPQMGIIFFSGFSFDVVTEEANFASLIKKNEEIRWAVGCGK